MTIKPSAFSAKELSSSFKPNSPFVDNPVSEVDAVLSKMVADPRRGLSPRQRAGISGRALNNGTLQRISQRTSADIQDAQSLLQVLPDLELAMQILISSILSPKDLGRAKIGYTVDKGRFNSDVTSKLVACVQEFFDRTYRINDLLPKILEDVLFIRGSYPLMVLPENVIDTIINNPDRVSFESVVSSEAYKNWMSDSIGLLGPAVIPEGKTGTSWGLEHEGGYAQYETKLFAYESEKRDRKTDLDLKITVSDNPDIFKRRLLEDRLRQARVSDQLNRRGLGNVLNKGKGKRSQVSVERLQSGNEAISASQAVGGGGIGNVTGTVRSFSDHGLYNNRRSHRVSQVSTIPNADQVSRPSVGHPLVMKLPAESVIPAHVPGEPENHIGFFVLLDERGNAVCYESSRDYYSDMGMMLKQNESMTSQIIQTTRRVTNGQRDPNVLEDQRQLTEAYIDLVEMDLQARLKNGAYGDNVQIARPEEAYRLMMARTYSQRITQLLWVPAEMLTYIAFDYNEYGIGVSLLQKSKIIGGIRATLLFANTMAGIKNSIARTRLQITLDPDDPEPDMTVEEYIHNYVRQSRGMLPVGINEPNDIVAHLNNAAVEVEVEGDNPRYPNTKMLVESYQSDKGKPDTELEDSMRDRHLMALGIPPELLVQAKNLEFATQIVQNNLLMTRNVMKYQDLFLPFIEEHVVRYVVSSQPLMDELRELVRANIDTLSAAQKNDQQEADASGKLDVDDQDLKALVGAVKDTNTDDTVGVDAVIYEFLQSLRLTLPTPETNAIRNQKEALADYDEALEKMLNYWFSEDFLTQDFLGPMASVVGPTKAALKAHLMRQYCRSNNILPELDDLTVVDSLEGPAIDLMKTVLGHQDGLSASLLSFMKHVYEQQQKITPQFEKAQQNAGGDQGGFGGGFGGGGGFSDTGTLDGGDAGAGVDPASGAGLDMNLDMPAGPDATGGGGEGDDPLGDLPPLT